MTDAKTQKIPIKGPSNTSLASNDERETLVRTGNGINSKIFFSCRRGPYATGPDEVEIRIAQELEALVWLHNKLRGVFRCIVPLSTWKLTSSSVVCSQLVRIVA